MLLKSKILHGCNDNFHVRVIWMVLKEHSISSLVFKNLKIGLQGYALINLMVNFEFTRKGIQVMARKSIKLFFFFITFHEISPYDDWVIKFVWRRTSLEWFFKENSNYFWQGESAWVVEDANESLWMSLPVIM